MGQREHAYCAAKAGAVGQSEPNSLPERAAGAAPRRCATPAAEAPLYDAVSVFTGLADLIGEEAADKLVARFGGLRLYVPHLPQAGDLLTTAVGETAAQRLAEIYGGDRVEIPNPAPRRVLIVELRGAGLSVDAIARHLRCTRRRVFQVLAEHRGAQS